MNNRFKIVGLIIIGVGLILSFYAGPKIYNYYINYQAYKAWRVNFPQTTKRVDKLPNRDSLYVFIMAGQSNMAGCGFVEPQDTLPNKKILTIDKWMNWVYAKEPLHFYEPSLTGLDCGMSFANTVLDAIPEGYAVAVIPCAVGGSSVEQWLNNENHRGVTLLDNFKEKVSFAADYGIIKGIIWHQGENNAHPKLIPHYAQRLDSLLKTFRLITNNDTLPIVLGELGTYAQPNEKQMQWDAINTVLNNIAIKDEGIALVKTGDLKHKGDYLHFNAESLRKLGERYAVKYLELIKPTYHNAAIK